VDNVDNSVKFLTYLQLK